MDPQRMSVAAPTSAYVSSMARRSSIYSIVHRLIPIIETLANYIKQGKLGGISLSECSADSIRRAAEVHEISAVEVEFSMFSLDILENGVTKACAELDIPVIAYSSLQ